MGLGRTLPGSRPLPPTAALPSSTHCTLDAPGHLPKQLRLGVCHLCCVEQVLPLDPLELQHPLEHLGGCGGGGSEVLCDTAGHSPSSEPHRQRAC